DRGLRPNRSWLLTDFLGRVFLHGQDPQRTASSLAKSLREVTMPRSVLRGDPMPTINNGAVSEVKAVLDGWEAAWNASDMNAMWQLATDDIHWVNVVGMHWRGKAEVQKAHQVFFDLLFRNRSCKLEEIESIETLPGGAFVAVVRWSMGGYRRPNGEMRPPGKDCMSLVLVPRGEGLAIAHGANVPIDEAAEAHNPIKR
ncbi:SgcJ/EcaC family oxidoreductase, partial [Bradyrhizobium sp. AUGA SZCCT0431]|uniref:SgcJ/EcaC family oxidoreductase n=1 Tax=Bradyrhizobium sp. AUGA SZCCT0431 TaxID=2807674 RepID=UPI001BAA00CE